MTVGGLAFLILLLLAACGFFLLPGPRSRRAALWVMNLGFLYTVVADWQSAVMLAAWLGSGYLAALALRARPSRWGLAAYITALLAVFVWLKKYAFLEAILLHGPVNHSLAIIGLSYMLFRQIHFVVDAMQDQIARPSLGAYLNYQLCLFTLTAGPIARYNEYAEYWHNPQPLLPGRHEILMTYLRLLVGIVMVGLLADEFRTLHERCFAVFERAAAGALPAPSRGKLLASFAGIFYAYPAYVYINFAGYCHIVIAGAALLGLALPENFDRPYVARNMIDFWNRWHRTLSYWIRDYLFTPMYKAIAERNMKLAPSLAFACYFVALTLAGVWHGSTWNFLVFGLLHGTGVSAAKLWENRIVAKRGRPGLRAYLASRPIRAAAMVATFHFVCFTFLFFPAELDKCLIPFRVLLARLTGGHL